jgi:hypothetical protein
MIALILATVSAATWTPLPLVDGSYRIMSLSALGDTLLACGAGGCARTADRGANWIAHPQTTPPDVQARFSGAFGLAELEGRVLRSLDGGRQWTPWNDGLPATEGASTLRVLGNLAFVATYATTRSEGVVSYSSPCGAYVRTRDASTWTPVGSSSLTECDEIAFGPGEQLLRISRAPETSPAVNHRLERSLDGGRTWDSVLAGVYGLHDHGRGILAVHLESTDSSVLSLDSGRTWTLRTGYLESDASLDGAVKPYGLGRWIDPRTGATRLFGLDSLSRVRHWARTGNVLWASGTHGLFSSVDSGRTWARGDLAFPLEYAPALASLGGRLHRFGARGDLIRLSTSDDGGVSWTQLPGTHFLVGDPDVCGHDLLAPTRTGTLVVAAGKVRTEEGGFFPEAIDCSGRSLLGFDGSRLAAWSDTGWQPFAKTVRGVSYPFDLAATDAGVFFQVDGSLDDRMGVSFLPAGADSARRGPPLPYVKSIQGSPRGAWVSTSRGLFLCTDASTCGRIPLPGIDSLWSFLGVQVQEGFVFASALPMGLTYDLDFSRPRLFASADSGKTWSSFDLPALVRSFQATSRGILASSYGRGLWLLEDPLFRTTSVGPRAGSRAISPSVTLHGRTLVASGLQGSASVRILDASGRMVLDRPLQVRDGSATLSLGSAPRGLLLVQITSGGRTTNHGIVTP